MSVVVNVGPNADGTLTRYERFKTAAGNAASAAKNATKSAARGIGNYGLHSACDVKRISDLKSAELYAMKTDMQLSEADFYKIQNNIRKEGGMCKSNRLSEFEKGKINAGSTTGDIEAELSRLSERANAHVGGRIPTQFEERIRRERMMGKSKGGCKSCMGAIIL